jgi:hypothetical protein
MLFYGINSRFRVQSTLASGGDIPCLVESDVCRHCLTYGSFCSFAGFDRTADGLEKLLGQWVTCSLATALLIICIDPALPARSVTPFQ